MTRSFSLLLALAFALGGCSAKEKTDALLARLEEGSASERLAALKELSRSPKALDLPELRLLLDDPSPAMRSVALSIAAKRREPQVLDWVGGKVTDPDPDVRRAALDALLRFEDPARERFLIAAYPLQDLAGRKSIVDELEHRDEKLLRLIAQEAMAIWERNLEALKRGGVAELVGALDLVGRSGRPEAVERLVGLLGSDSTRVVEAAARGLALSGGGGEAREGLEALLQSEIPARRLAGREALRSLGYELPADDEPEAAIEAPEAEPFWEKVKEISGEEGSEIASTLVFMAQTPNETGARALAELEKRGEAERILEIYKDTGSASAAAALGRMGRSEAAKALLDPGSAGEVTPAWLLSLAGSGASATGAAARLHLAHDRPEIRAAAAELLRERCDWKAMPLLRALAANDYYIEVRRAAQATVEATRGCPPR